MPFRRRFLHILNREPDIFHKAVIRMLATAIIAYMSMCLVLLAILAAQSAYGFPFWRTVVIFFLFVFCFAALLYSRRWQVAAHGLILTLSVMVWSNVILFEQGVNLVTLQYVLVVLVGSYYMLGVTWGLIYSLLDILPILAYIVIKIYDGGEMALQSQYVDSQAFIFVLVFNFAFLVFINYYFFKAFKKSTHQEKELKKHLERAVGAAEELSDAKTNFLSTMSHELRTPLNAVVGITNILLSENPREEQRENLAVLRTSSEDLMAIINDILDFNKIDRGLQVLTERNFEPAVALEDVAESLKAKAIAKGLEFVCFTDPSLHGLRVSGDEHNLRRVLDNLLSNSVKFTSSGSVRISALAGERTEDSVSIQFKIEDTGIGIPPDRQKLIFEPFIQGATQSNRQYHGTGLGLTIANRLIRLHGSNLELSSEEGRGSTFQFIITYPIAKEQPERIAGDLGKMAENAPVAAPASLDKLRVLIAEDDLVNIMVMKKILNGWGIRPEIAKDGEQAVRAATENDYDVILMDINMPVMDGFEASKAIRELSDRKKATVRIIAVTASIGAAIEHLSGYQYLDDCLLKPFKPEELKEKLSGLL